MNRSDPSQYEGHVVLFHGPGKPLAWQATQWSCPKVGEVLVQITHSAICRSDLHTHCGHRAVTTPTVLGHEIIGRVVALGAQAPEVDLRGHPIAVGDRVTWSIYAHCGRCPNCQAGWPQKCAKLFKYGHEPVAKDGQPSSGGMASYILLRPGTAILVLEPTLPDQYAVALNCAMATAAAVTRQGEVARRKDPVVVVMGGGYAGLSTVALCRAQGAGRVVVVETQRSLHARALSFGADAAFHPEDDSLKAWISDHSSGRGADQVMEMAGSSAAAQLGLDLLAVGGVLMLAGTVFPSPALALDPEAVVRRCQIIKGMHNYAPEDLVLATEFLAHDGAELPWDSLHGGLFPLAESQAAFELALQLPGKRVILMP